MEKDLLEFEKNMKMLKESNASRYNFIKNVIRKAYLNNLDCKEVSILISNYNEEDLYK